MWGEKTRRVGEYVEQLKKISSSVTFEIQNICFLLS